MANAINWAPAAKIEAEAIIRRFGNGFGEIGTAMRADVIRSAVLTAITQGEPHDFLSLTPANIISFEYEIRRQLIQMGKMREDEY